MSRLYLLNSLVEVRLEVQLFRGQPLQLFAPYLFWRVTPCKARDQLAPARMRGHLVCSSLCAIPLQLQGKTQPGVSIRNTCASWRILTRVLWCQPRGCHVCCILLPYKAPKHCSGSSTSVDSPPTTWHYGGTRDLCAMGQFSRAISAEGLVAGETVLEQANRPRLVGWEIPAEPRLVLCKQPLQLSSTRPGSL